MGERDKMSNNPLVSILIPVYNRENMIATALSSAMAQTYPNIEIVVVDNCSTDRTYEVVQEYARRDQRIRCFRNDENLGPVRNWKRCLEYSRGEYVKILFSDDWLEPDAVERLLIPLMEHPDAGFSYSSVQIHYETTGQTVRAYEQGKSRLMDSAEFLRGQLTGRPSVPVSPGCALFRRKDVEQGLEIDIPNRLGLACAQIGFGSDLLLFLRTCERYPKVYYEASVLSHFRGHEGSITISDRGKVGGLCYNIAFAWFLATSKLPVRQKRYLNALLFIRTLSLSGIMAAGYKNPLQVYSRMFPEQYNCWDMAPLSRDAAIMLFCKAKALLTKIWRRDNALPNLE
jgi:glycosyltransferase involved in cell wall biosynthesis